VAIDPRYFRPTEVELLLGDAQKARTKLNWEPTIAFRELVKMMVKYDCLQIEKELNKSTSGIS